MSRGTQPIGVGWVLGGSILLVTAGMATLHACSPEAGQPARHSTKASVPARAVRSDSAHFTARSTATPGETRAVLAAAEALRTAYVGVFARELRARPAIPRMQLVLYGTRAEFQAHNRSRPWAEAYYLPPASYAYVARGVGNPYHWMLHEATHQLNRELAGFRRVAWSDEGVASYFGTSRIVDGVLRPGDIDPATYPVWWLASARLSGDFARDVRVGQVIPLRELMAGRGPGIDGNVNLYYIHYWSLSHFLFEYDHGRYADGYRRFLSSPVPLDFEATVGPLDRIEPEWYAYLQALVAAHSGGETSVEVQLE